MTTYYNFAPSPSGPFTFQPTLDGNVYSAVVIWNLQGQRWYINIYDASGTLIIAQAMVGSDTGLNIQSLAWANGSVQVTTTVPHGYRIGQTFALTLAGSAPSAYNGKFNCLVTGASTLTFPLGADPGAATAFGVISYDISLTAGYFSSTLVYRIANQQIEVSP